jgi:hypothetical protein
MKSKELFTPIPSDPTSVPSTGNQYVDRALDALSPDAKLAILAILERAPTEGDIQNEVEARFLAQTDWMNHPEAVQQFCQSADDGDLEERIVFWQVYRAAKCE